MYRLTKAIAEVRSDTEQTSDEIGVAVQSWL